MKSMDWKAITCWLLLLTLVVIHQWKLWGWQVDDAAISFGYARNWADGHGLVAFVGQERVEGYSNPLWVGLLALWELVGIHGFDSAKWMGVGLAFTAVFCAWRAASVSLVQSRLLPPLVGLTVAMSASLGIWSTSGLETPLFAALLSAGIWRTLVEDRDGGVPWSALLFLGLAITRPEGIMYAAFAGLWALVAEMRGRRQWWRIGAWLAVFFVPFAVYHWVRYDYFAQLFPSTYHAKMGGRSPDLFHLNRRGWRQLGAYSRNVMHLEFLPLYLLGLLGLRGWRGLLWLFTSAGMLALYLSDSFGPRWSAQLLVGLAVLLPLLAIGNRRWPVRVLCWVLVMAGMFFSIRSDGDWMKGYRWMGQITVPLSILLALGIWECARRMRYKPLLLVFLALVLGRHGSNQYAFTWEYKPPPKPKDVRVRLNLFRDLANVLHMEPERLTVVDHDLGGLIWWGGYFGWIYDSVGLVNLPIALNKHEKWKRAFFREYLVAQDFDFTHLHGKTRSALAHLRPFKTKYVEVMGYPPPKRKHKANYARRDLFLRTDIAPPADVVRYESGVALYKLHAWPKARPDGYLFVQLQLTCGDCTAEWMGEDNPFTVEFVLDGAAGRQTYSLSPGYDWVDVPDWKDKEVFDGRYSVRMPEDMSEGTYRYGVRLLDRDDQPILTVDGADMVWQGDVEVVPSKQIHAEIKRRFAKVTSLAKKGRCRAAIATWDEARLFKARAGKWRRSKRRELGPYIADCLVRTAAVADDASVQARLIRRARKWDLDSAELLAFAAERGAELHTEGMAARDAEDWPAAFDAFSAAVRIEPSRSWSRRYAEEARAHRLGGR